MQLYAYVVKIIFRCALIIKNSFNFTNYILQKGYLDELEAEGGFI